MGFRITCDDSCADPVVLRVEGHLLGEDAARVLREQIAHAASGGGSVIVDLHDVAWDGDPCLAILQEPPGRVSLAGGGALLATLLDQRRSVLPVP